MKRFVIKSAVAALLSFVAVGAHAYSGSLTPPAGWSSVGAVHSFNLAQAGSQASLNLGRISANAALTVGGRSVTLPVSMRVGGGVARVAAAALYLSPHLRTAVGIAAWLGIGKVVWDAANNQWVAPDDTLEQSDGYEYGITGLPQRFPTVQQGCAAMMQYVKPGMSWVQLSSPYAQGLNCYAMGNGQPWSTGTLDRHIRQDCPAGWYITPAVCVQNAPPKVLNPDDFVERLDPARMPDTVPKEIPNLPLPVDIPVINPDPATDPNSPATPLFIPTGNPFPNPNYDPNAAPGPNNMPWLQPGFRVIPTPTPWAPWQIDVRPVNRPVPTPTPNWLPYPDPIPNPWDVPDPSREKQEDFCAKNPTSIACEKGDFADTELPKIPKLYERKYPDGMVGIWNQKKEAFMSSNLGTLAGAMMPTGMQAGTCPSFQIDLSMSSWAEFGSHDLSPPCWVWDFAKVVVLISAVILARQLIFGG